MKDFIRISRQVAAPLAFLAAVALSASPVAADFIPPDLPIGSQYRIIFTTDGETPATPTSIDYYNSFVTAEAALNPAIPQGATWRAIASTFDVAAIVNAPMIAGVPIYNTRGQLVVAGTGNLYGENLLNIPRYSQYGGNDVDSVPFTGSNPDGSIHPVQYLGNTFVQPSGSIYAIGGFNQRTDSLWITFTGFLGHVFVATDPQPLYALSSPITVVPEPSSLVLAGAAVLALMAVARRKSAQFGFRRTAA